MDKNIRQLPDSYSESFYTFHSTIVKHVTPLRMTGKLFSEQSNACYLLAKARYYTQYTQLVLKARLSHIFDVPLRCGFKLQSLQ